MSYQIVPVTGTYQNGFAPRDGAARYPQLWRGSVLALHPGLGPSGSVLREWAGGRNNGTLTLMDPATDWVLGKGGYVLDFDGSNDYVAATYDGTRIGGGVGDWSMSFWSKVPTTSESGLFVKLSDSSNNGVGVGVGGSTFDNNGNKLIVLYESVAWKQSSISLGTGWNHITVIGVRSGTALTCEVWMNGKYIETLSSSNPRAVSDSGVIQIGGYPLGNRYANVQITDVMIHDRKLAASENSVLSTRPGIAYELDQRRMFSPEQAAAFKAYWANRRSQIIGSGVGV